MAVHADVSRKITHPLHMRLRDGTVVEVPDPMCLDPWVEQDEPLASDFHEWEQRHCVTVLERRFAGEHCYISANRWLYVDPADLNKKLQPDILVALGVPHRGRTEYDPAIEGKAPDVLIEYLSDSSLQADQHAKPRRYAELGVREYWLFNPYGVFAAPRIQGWALQRDGTREPLPAADGSVASRVLPVRFVTLDGLLEVLDRETGRRLSESPDLQDRYQYEAEARRQAEALARQEAEARGEAEARAAAAEAELTRLRALLDRLGHDASGGESAG